MFFVFLFFFFSGSKNQMILCCIPSNHQLNFSDGFVMVKFTEPEFIRHHVLKYWAAVFYPDY